MPHFTDADLDEFERLAMAASQANWQVGHHASETHEAASAFVAESISKSDATDLWMVCFGTTNDEGVMEDAVTVAYTGNGLNSENNAVYVAACKPANILALIRELRRLRPKQVYGGLRHA